MIYLDNNATTPIDPVVIDAMQPYLSERFGNPGALYSIGKEAVEAVDLARHQVAEFVGADPTQVVFTSSGTEANNMVFYSQINRLSNNKFEVLVSRTEHESILKTVNHLEQLGLLTSRLIPVDTQGMVDDRSVSKMITKATGIVSVMMVNNEVGTVNPVKNIAEICKSNDILFHTDCVQAAGIEKLDFKEIGCNFMTISSHKIHGPKGVGAMVSNVHLDPMICGGAMQEFGVRGGTENVAGIVGFGKACEIMKNELANTIVHTSVLKQKFFALLLESLHEAGLDDIVQINGNQLIRPGKTLNIRFDKVDGETLLLLLDKKGVCVSAGAACSSHESIPSHVLLAMGVNYDDARNSIRISFSRMNTESEIAKAASIMGACVHAIRCMN